MEIRKFTNSDGPFCFKTRSHAFIVEFHNYLSPVVIAEFVNKYMVEDYIEMSKSSEIFILTADGERKGFFTIKKRSDRAEIPFIYMDLNCTGKGFGSKIIEYIDEWVISNWPEVKLIFVDTIIPDYNRGFYKKAGFTDMGNSSNKINGVEFTAKRFEKKTSLISTRG